MQKQHLLLHTVLSFISCVTMTSLRTPGLLWHFLEDQITLDDLTLTRGEHILSFWGEGFASCINKTNTNRSFVCVYIQVIAFLAFYKWTFFFINLCLWKEVNTGLFYLYEAVANGALGVFCGKVPLYTVNQGQMRALKINQINNILETQLFSTLILALICFLAKKNT